MDKTRRNDPTLDDALHWGLTHFQTDYDLNRDGYSRPGGETEAKLNSLITPMIQLAAMRGSDSQNTMAVGANEGRAFSEPLGDEEAGGSVSPTPRIAGQQIAQATTQTSGTTSKPSNSGTVPPLPTYPNQSGSTNTRLDQSDWDRFHKAMDTICVPPLKRDVYGKIYSAEGGGAAGGTTASGITSKTLNEYFDASVNEATMKWVGPRLKTAGIAPGMTLNQLTPEQRVAFYKIYLDSDVGPSKASGGKIDGIDVLNKKVADDKSIAAIADRRRTSLGWGACLTFKDTSSQETNSTFDATLRLPNGSSFVLRKISDLSAN
jgi:hypothetical protein